MKIELQYVHFMPKVLQPGVLYVSKEFDTAAHLCACGCGSKVRTPLAPTEWTLEVNQNLPSLKPSIGNWQLPCQSHYWITNGQIVWSYKWTQEQILAGRQMEEKRRRAYFDNLDRRNSGFLQRIIYSIKSFLGLK